MQVNLQVIPVPCAIKHAVSCKKRKPNFGDFDSFLFLSLVGRRQCPKYCIFLTINQTRKIKVQYNLFHTCLFKPTYMGSLMQASFNCEALVQRDIVPVQWASPATTSPCTRRKCGRRTLPRLTQSIFSYDRTENVSPVNQGNPFSRADSLHMISPLAYPEV